MYLIKNIFIITIFQLLLLINKSYSLSDKGFIKIPFIIPSPNSQSISNSETFLQNYFSQKLILNISLGTQNINGIISQDESCLNFIDEEKYNNDDNNIYKNIKKYLPKDSSTFDIRTEKIYISYQPDEYMVLGSDYFLFDSNKYNLSFLFLKTQDQSEINYNLIKNKKYIAKLGIVLYDRDVHFSEKCPQFTYDTKKIANLSKYLLSFEFTENNKGNIIYGNELYIYNKKKYHESQYTGSYASVHHQIYFNRIYLYNDNNNINITEGTYALFDYNSGIIIGTKKYKEKIDNIFFNNLKGNNICLEEKILFNKTSNYSVYSCDENNFKNKIKNFPKIILESKNFEYNFELNYDDLFLKIGNKYYFIIIFKENYKDNTWIFGQPFYKKYKFTASLDQYWVGFYNPNKPIIEEEDDNNDEEGLNTKAKTIIIIVSLCLFFIGLAIAMFFLGQKLRNDRKKRANELTDDNYDYSAGIISETAE